MKELNFVYYPKNTRMGRKAEQEIHIGYNYIGIKGRLVPLFKEKFCYVYMTPDKKYLKLEPTSSPDGFACCETKGACRVGTEQLIKRLGITYGGRRAQIDVSDNTVIVEL